MLNVIMIGSTGAVGQHVLQTLLDHPEVRHVTTLGRRRIDHLCSEKLTQHVVDMEDAQSYAMYIKGHDRALCTLGVGEPSSVSKEMFVRIDKDMVLEFAQACRQAEVEHFELLSSVGVSSNSPSFYLRTKGELEEALENLKFSRLSLFHPSMILTPTNRYGLGQALTLSVWPRLHWLMQGRAKSLRGVAVEVLGASMALNLFKPPRSEQTPQVEVLEWEDFHAIVGP